MRSSAEGIVYLVGAGPGDVGLITIRGVECLRRADVVVYDNLANSELLLHTPDHCEFIYAGKKADQHTKCQDEINSILADKARAGLTVVRLKGGDPFLFGRGGEEAGWLTDRGIRWEVVPGVTSSIAVPAYAGIPVTHRSVNGSLHVVTGHENREGLGADIDWKVLAQSRGTIVLLMGIKNLETISQELIRYGRDLKTPTAVIQWGTRAAQKTVVSTLDSIVKAIADADIKPPAVTVIGEVVQLRENLTWFEKKPLFGFTIAVTRPLEQNKDLGNRLYELGAEVVRTPSLKVIPANPGADGNIVERLKQNRFDWIIFTSSIGVRYFVKSLLDDGGDLRQLAGISLAAIGLRTADSLKSFGLQADFVAQDFSQEGLIEGLAPYKPTCVLIARAREARSLLENVLKERGTEVHIQEVYQTVPDQKGIERLCHLLAAGKIDVVTFTSARTFEELQVAIEGRHRMIVDMLKGVKVAVIGPVTRSVVEKAGVSVDMIAERADMQSLAEAILQWRQSRNLQDL